MNAILDFMPPARMHETLAKANCRSLARIIADLVNENEPLLRAECVGASVTVSERGGTSVMTFTVETQDNERIERHGR